MNVQFVRSREAAVTVTMESTGDALRRKDVVPDAPAGDVDGGAVMVAEAANLP